MKNQLPLVSIILRLTLGIGFLLNGSYGLKELPAAELPLFIGYEWLYYLYLIELIIAICLIFGAFTKVTSILMITVTLASIVTSKLFFAHPFWGLLQSSQLLAQIGALYALYLVGSPTLSFDAFFFWKYRESKNVTAEVEKFLIYSLAISFALTFTSIFLFIDERNYIVFAQWFTLSKFVPIINMPLIGSFFAISAVLLFLGYNKRPIAFASAILFLIAAVVTKSHFSEILAMLGASLGILALPANNGEKLKVIPKRK